MAQGHGRGDCRTLQKDESMKTAEQAAERYADTQCMDGTAYKAFLAGVAWADRWIPVDEELPKEGALCLIKDKFNKIELGVWNGYEWQCEDIDCVALWRPIEHK